jgi:hypothetical protein
MTKHSKEVLREARTTSPTLPMSTQRAVRGMRVYNPIQDRMGPFSGKAYRPSNRAMPSKASTDTATTTGTVSKSGILGNVGKLVLDLAKSFGKGFGYFGGAGAGAYGAWKLFSKEIAEMWSNFVGGIPGLPDSHSDWLEKNGLIVLISIGLVAGTAEAARRLTPRIMKVFRNRRITNEISEALDAGDETLARTILLDAIEDENINLSAIRRKLGDDDYERLYRDYL